MDAISFYKAGQLDLAIESVVASVKAAPTNNAARFLFIELLCFRGDWERADKQLDVIAKQVKDVSPKDSEVDMLFALLLRQLIRGEMQREKLIVEGRVPSLLRELPEHAQLQLRTIDALRDQNAVSGRTSVIEASSMRPPMQGLCNSHPFSAFQDLDDRFAGVLELITSSGDYFWVPFDLMRSITFEKPERPADLIWRKVVVDIENGPVDTTVYVPVRYPIPTVDGWDDQLRLGRATTWVGESEGVVRGVGQRMYLIGDEAQGIMDLENLQFGATS